MVIPVCTHEFIAKCQDNGVFMVCKFCEYIYAYCGLEFTSTGKIIGGEPKPTDECIKTLKHLDTSQKDRLKEELDELLFDLHIRSCQIGDIKSHDICNKFKEDLRNWILSHAKEIGSLI